MTPEDMTRKAPASKEDYVYSKPTVETIANKLREVFAEADAAGVFVMLDGSGCCCESAYITVHKSGQGKQEVSP